jgi:hypothetical protein
MSDCDYLPAVDVSPWGDRFRHTYGVRKALIAALCRPMAPIGGKSNLSNSDQSDRLLSRVCHD